MSMDSNQTNSDPVPESNNELRHPSSASGTHLETEEDQEETAGTEEHDPEARSPRTGSLGIRVDKLPDAIKHEIETETGSGERTGTGETEEESELDPFMAKKIAYEKRKQQRKLQELRSKTELEMEEEEEDEAISLLERHDSELTPSQIVEKDIMMYDLLMSHEELMELPDDTKITQYGVVPADEEDEEDEGEEEEEEEEIEEMQEEEEHEEEDEEEAETERRLDSLDLDDPDNLVNMMMMEQEDEDDVKLIFKSDFSDDIQIDTLAKQEGIVGISLSDETKTFMEIEPDITEWREKWVWLSHKKVMLHIFIYGEKSEFFPHYEVLKKYPDFAMLLGYDTQQQTGHPFFLCVTVEARNFVMNPPKKRRKAVDAVKTQEQDAWDKLASIIPRKWKSLGSEIEVDELILTEDRPPIKVYAYRFAELFGKPVAFSDSKFKGVTYQYAEFESKDTETLPTIEKLEVDKAVQVNPPKVTSEVQTSFSFRRNKMTQHEVQEVDPELVEKELDSTGLATFLHKIALPMEKCLQQNEMLNIMTNDYQNLKAAKGYEIEFNNESVLLQEYHTYADLRHSKGRSATFLQFHPLLDELVIMGFTEDVTFDKRIEFHSKMLMDPNFVILWDLKDPTKPALMLDAPSDVFCAMVSPSDPHLICGGCENGQVVLWDLGRYYVELRNRIQDRKRKESDKSKNSGKFLEKLKDSSEKYVCPLIPPSGLSCLEVSHKQVITCVHWLPAHVELGKNGNLYENSWGYRSAQFFSVAGDSSLRVWDIRAQKIGLDEFDQDMQPTTKIKHNPWSHLENNAWKYTSKYNLDDGSGSMTCTIITLSEGRLENRFFERPTMGSTVPSMSSNANKDTTASHTKETGSASGSVAGSKSRLKTQEKSMELNDRHASTNSDAKSNNSVAAKSEKAGTGSGHSGQSAHSGKSNTIAGARSTGFGETESEGMSAAYLRHTVGGGGNAQALTSFFAGCANGMVALVDWLRNRDGTVNPDAAGNKNCQSIYTRVEHNGSITSVSRSPFFQDLLIVVGGGTVSIWKEKSAHPIISTLGEEQFAWCACWSPTRPAVFFVGTRDGSLEVWDLMDKCHAPVLTQQVTPGRITSIGVPKAMTSKKHFLAAGDSHGNLYVVLIPRYYTRLRPNENGTVLELMSREENRLNSWGTQAEVREEKIQKIHTEWVEKRVKKSEKQIAEQEVATEGRLAKEYDEFLEFQTKLVSKLKREEPSLPTDEQDIDAELDALIKQAEDAELDKMRSKMEEEEE